jgi:hypothetical protein
MMWMPEGAKRKADQPKVKMPKATPEKFKLYDRVTLAIEGQTVHGHIEYAPKISRGKYFIEFDEPIKYLFPEQPDRLFSFTCSYAAESDLALLDEPPFAPPPPEPTPVRRVRRTPIDHSDSFDFGTKVAKAGGNR